MALIAGGDRRGGPGLLLRIAPLRFLGRISYALYLWHWPLLVLVAAAYGAALPPALGLTVVAVSVLMATASTLLVEEPIRRRTAYSSGRRMVRLAVTPVLAMVLALVVGLGATTWVTERTLEQVAAADPGRAAGPPEDLDGDAAIEGLDEAAVPTASTAARPRIRAAERAQCPRPQPKPKRTPKPRKTPNAQAHAQADTRLEGAR